eukprot:TRINITY_DN43659_c0_g1_i1.p1 TRINITY_DN43659_c0_g1~~TRINITY_DN43659_c0_g1_i1.p1  ORF type:complete len:512 (+),score=130.49 TRINITY_DN43659_c0_g1_i1:35-1537(+)
MNALLPVMLAGALAQAPPTRVKVASLPGMTGPLPSTMWSGFVDGGAPPSGKGNMYFHYVAFESETDPANAPTVFWYNGGPGASSLFGLFQELGPLYLNEDSKKTPAFNQTGIPTPLPNPFGWSKKFNLFAIDSPAPVGFSYCTEFGPSGNGTSCGPWKDSDVFKANHKVVTTIMNSVFPEWLKNPLFITGESYAGVYIPGLINALLDDMQGLNLKGYAIGDGCMGTNVVCMNMDGNVFDYPSVWAGPYYDIQFFAGHGQISNELYGKIRRDCTDVELRGPYADLSQQCKDYVQQMKNEVGGFFVYDLYDDCPQDWESDGLHLAKSKRRQLLKSLPLGGAVNEYACTGTAMIEYLNRSDVLTALGLATNSFFFNADNGEGFVYVQDETDVRPIHTRAAKAGLRILTYEGDADASGLSSYGLQDVYSALWPSIGYTKSQTWRPWTIDGRKYMGGYVMEWNNGQVAHLTIRGSGHMVPLNKPPPALAMINSFVFNQDYPKYNP